MPADTVTLYKELLPSFYFDMFKEQDLLESILRAVDLVHLQSQHNQAQEDRTSAVIEADPFQTTITERLTLSKSNRTSIRYGDGYTYEDGYIYGEQDPDTLETVYDLGDPEIISIGYIADKVENPSAVYTEGVDFIINKGLIIFKGSISDYFPSMENSIDDALVQERGFHLMGYNVRREIKNIYNYFGYAIEYGTPTTYRGKEIFKSIWKLFTFGPSWYHVMRAVSLATGVDVSKSISEKILAYKTTAYSKVVITDRNTYKCREDATTDNGDIGTTISFGYPVTGDVDVVWDLDRAFNTEGGIFDPIGGGSDPIYVYSLNSEVGYIDPSSLILVQIPANSSNFIDLKLIDILYDLLPKSTRLVLQSVTNPYTAYQTSGSGPGGNVTEITQTGIMTKYTALFKENLPQPIPVLLASKR